MPPSPSTAMRTICRSFASGNGPWNWPLASKRHTRLRFSSAMSVRPPAVTTAASIFASGSVSPGLSVGTLKDRMSRGPTLTAIRAATTSSPAGPSERPCRSAPFRIAPTLPSAPTGTTPFTLSEAIHRTRAGVMRIARTSFRTSPDPAVKAGSSAKTGLAPP